MTSSRCSTRTKKTARTWGRSNQRPHWRAFRLCLVPVLGTWCFVRGPSQVLSPWCAGSGPWTEDHGRTKPSTRHQVTAVSATVRSGAQGSTSIQHLPASFQMCLDLRVRRIELERTLKLCDSLGKPSLEEEDLPQDIVRARIGRAEARRSFSIGCGFGNQMDVEERHRGVSLQIPILGIQIGG